MNHQNQCSYKGCNGTTYFVTELEHLYGVALCDPAGSPMSHYMAFMNSDDKQRWVNENTNRPRDYKSMTLAELLREAASVMSYHEAAIDEYGWDNHSLLQKEMLDRANNAERFANQIQFLNEG